VPVVKTCPRKPVPVHMDTTDEIKRDGALRRMNSLLGELGPFVATAILTCAAVVAALATLLVVAAFGGPRVTWTIAGVATATTVVVAAPIVLYSQFIIRKLRSSRRALKDVTSRLAVALDQAARANQAKSAFLANMSHELRTPLNAIIGFSEMIRDQHIGPVGSTRYISYADDIHTSGTYLLRIINDILDLAKIESGERSTEAAEEFDIHDTAEASVRIVRPLAARSQVSLVSEIPPFAIRLVAVERMVQQILINLLTNAVKFTPEGGTVRLGCALRRDGSCVVTVRDTGVGMTKDEVSRSLVPFGQIANAMTRKHDGTGLGLPLSKAMMELHEGALRVRSAPQKGTLVSLTFPATRVVVCENNSGLRATG
jgi:signal transduction histidine kinase